MAEDLGPSAGKIRVKITCPTHLVADMEANSVLIPALRGAYLIKPRKAPEFYLLNSGQVVLHQQNKPDKVFFVSRGVCEVRRDICAIMAWAEEKTTCSVDSIRLKLEQGEKLLATLSSEKATESLRSRLDFYRFILSRLK